jgi:nitric oxide dioxygenase
MGEDDMDRNWRRLEVREHDESLLPDLEAEFYLCGPIAFMAALQTDLEQLGVPTNQIHSESFGPA